MEARIPSSRLLSAVKAIAFAGLCLAATSVLADSKGSGKQLYRYINNQGVKVLDSSIPPEYVQNGYEVINTSGKLIRVVPPAPTDEQIALNEAKKEIINNYDLLRKRYSSVEAIEAARDRRLVKLDTSISILNGNITSLKNQLGTQMGAAANREREGKAVPDSLLKQIDNSKAELAVAEELQQIRVAEKEAVVDKFEKDIEYFIKGRELAQQQVEPKVIRN